MIWQIVRHFFVPSLCMTGGKAKQPYFTNNLYDFLFNECNFFLSILLVMCPLVTEIATYVHISNDNSSYLIPIPFFLI